ncbi:MAG: L,D-transpeptidase family protein, partial [Acidobacteria bacterium]|nr:L,D-transpeptidase family protein [Acidobacteriota bacterium]
MRFAPHVVALAAALSAGAPHGMAARQAPASEALRARIEQVRDVPSTRLHGARPLQPRVLVRFFEARSFEPACPVPFASDQIRAAIRDIEQDGLVPADYHLAAIEACLDERSTTPSAEVEIDLQLLLTDAVAALVDHVRYGKVHPVSLDKRWNVDPRSSAPPLETLVARVAAAPFVGGAIASFKPNHFIYEGLKGALAHLRPIVAAGGWPAVAPGVPLKRGARDRRLVDVRERLAVSGELPAGASRSDRYDAELEHAVKRFQERHRLGGDGTIGQATIEAMNVSAQARFNQVRVNLERARWVLDGLRDSFVLVNLPAFKVYVIRGAKNIWEARTQIGREARQTPSFRADMTYVVFNPDWTVPPTILAQDVLAGMRRGQNTIARKGLTILD